jgi:hypothetical protein
MTFIIRTLIVACLLEYRSSAVTEVYRPNSNAILSLPFSRILKNLHPKRTIPQFYLKK